MNKPNRPITQQLFTAYALVVALTPTPLNTSNQQANLLGLYDSFLISVPAASANAVWLGGANILAASLNGLEIRPGVPIMLSIHNERQLYEIQSPLVDKFCVASETIPFVAWDVSTVYLAAAVAPVTVGVILFKASFL